MKTIAIDAMGGDKGVVVTLPAAIAVLRCYPDVRMIFVGKSELLSPILAKKAAKFIDRWEIQPATEVVAMDESPALALRSKKDSSMRVALNCVKEGRADACVSAGNTGALMATARFVLKTIPGVDRPAIMARFPTKTGKDVHVLDLGANVDSTPEQLFQFAVMASTRAEAVDNIEKPSVGLLNIGSEDIKGNEQVKKAAELFSRTKAMHYIGFVEGDDIFYGKADIVVCDGFVGNSVLKACEGLSKIIFGFMKTEIKRNWRTKLAVFLAFPVLKRVKDHIDPRKRNGATLLGLNGVVIKSHGGADRFSFQCAIVQALSEIEKNVPELIREKVENTLRLSAL